MRPPDNTSTDAACFVAQRHHGGASRQRDTFCVGSKEAEVRERVEHLPDIAEGGVVGRNIPGPERPEAKLVGESRALYVVCHRWSRRVRVAFQWKDEAQAQPPGANAREKPG